jgi:hypothetical protein
MSLLLWPAPLAVLLAAASNNAAMLLLCFALTAVLFFYTFYFSPAGYAPERDRRTFLRERKDVVYENLRDLNFEYRAGKYPENDYQQMQAALEDEAATLLAEIEALEPAGAVRAGVSKSAADGGSSVISSQPRSVPAGRAGKGSRR